MSFLFEIFLNLLYLTAKLFYMKNLILFCAFVLSVFFTNAQITHYTFEQALIDDNVRSIEEDQSGNVWIGTISGITRFDGTDFTSFTTADGLGGDIVYDIMVSSTGDVYAATSGGLSVYNGVVWSNFTMGDGLPSNTIWSVEEDNLNQIWVGTSDMGVAYYNGLDWYVLGVDDGLVASGVKVIYADRNDNVWFGTGNGVSMYDGVDFTNFDNSTGLPGLLVNDIIQLYNGNVAVATSGGVGIYNFHSWTSITTLDGLPTANILSLRQDYAQNLWMAASVGLIKYDWSAFTVWDYDDGLTSSIASKLLITHASDNKIWIGSPFDGITVFDSDDDFIIYRTNKNLVNDNITTVYTDDEDITWIGTEGGLNRVGDLHWRTYHMSNDLTNEHITAIHKDINGNIWVGTIDGLNLLNGESFDQYTTVEGLTNNYINSITSDDLGFVYVATQDKVTVLDLGVVVDTIEELDGLNADEVKQIQFENGRLWFLQDTSVQFFDGAFTDATFSGCGTQPLLSGAKCLNNSVGQYFGTDNTLRYYEDGLTVSNCIAHPFPGTATMTSIVEIGTDLFCTFDNGQLMIYDGGWTPYPYAFPVSFIEQSFNQNYLWVGTQADGLSKICLNFTSLMTNSVTPPTCHDLADGQVNITAPVGSEYSVDYGENWQAGNTFPSEIGGYKHLLVRDASLNIISDSVIYLPYYDVIDDANITITQMLCNGDNNGTIELVYSNPGSHEWENANTTLYLRENLNAGIYSVTIYDAGTCNRVLENEMIEPDLLDYTLDYEDITCFGLANGSVDLTVTGGTLPYTYTWSNGIEEAENPDLIADDYYFTVTDASMCSTNGMQTIDQPDLLEVSGTEYHIDCYGEVTGVIDIDIVGGTTPYTVVWSDPAYVDLNDDIVDAPAGDYSVTVTDVNDCSVTVDYTINQPDEIEFISEDITQVLCYGDSTGVVDITMQGGTGVLSFEWVHEGEAGTYATSEDITELLAGIYHLTVTDENFCEITTDYEITQSPELEVTLDVTPITCGGYEDGEILAEATGGSGTYSAYYWYDEEENIIGVTPHITNLGAGYYEVVVRDSYYCYDTAYTTLSEATPHVYEIAPTSMSCNGLEDGQIEVIVDGGPGTGFTFDWQDAVAGNVNIAENLGVGEYFVTVTDLSDCSEILSAEIEEHYMEDIGAFNDVEYICYGNDLVLDPGTFVSYDWSTGSEDPTITVENEDVYFVEVIDGTGCNLGDTVKVIISTVYENEDLNLVSVTADNDINLYWEKTPGEGTASYNIYRDAGDGFEFLANQLYAEDAIYTDTDVDPTSEYYMYQITAVDSCGSESDYSDIHRTCLLDVVPDGNGACWLNWGEYQGFFVVYYFILSGTTPDNLEIVDSTLYNDFDWVEMNPNPEGTYYQIMVRRIDGCSPGDGEYYDQAYSNIVFCDNYVGFVNNAVVSTSVYPNPFYDDLNVTISMNIPGELKYSFYNVLGQEIIEPESINLMDGEQVISITPDLAPGMYILRLRFANEVYNLRVIKESY